MSPNRTVAADVAAILSPPPSQREGVDDLAFDAMCEAAAAERQRLAEQMELSWQEGNVDPLLAALRSAQRRRVQADNDIRRLIAYGREFVQPRPYTLVDLAEASAMSISGIRTVYDHNDVDAVTEATGARPRDWRATDPSDDQVGPLISSFQKRHTGADPSRPTLLAGVMELDGWVPHAPESRTPGARSARQYVRWERTWPNGTHVTLYQDPNTLATSGKLDPDDPRTLRIDYTGDNPHTMQHELDAYCKRIAEHDASLAS